LTGKKLCPGHHCLTSGGQQSEITKSIPSFFVHRK
jgi:hypothetical protein